MLLAAATREYESGWIDRPLWESVLAQSKGDEALAKAAYVRTRATILQLEKRDHPGEPGTTRANLPRQTDSRPVPQEIDRVSRHFPRPILTRRMLVPAVSALVAMVAIGIWLIARGGAVDSAPQPSAATATGRFAQPDASTRTVPASPARTNTGNAMNAVSADEGLGVRIAKLRDAGNWNVMVLLASEWTRREPANVQAWIQLSVGYARLRQFGDALEAATKATQLAPADPLAWRNLAQVRMESDQRAEALQAFEQAVALDGRDVQSLVRVGMLNAQLAQFPQAKAAFDKVLTANPDDVDAWCGSAFVARQQGQVKDADSIEKKLQALGRTCQDWNDHASADQVVSHPASYIRVPPGTR